ncbi:MAG: type I 3-dehydroquinate dehydratase [Ramlibacter sp.]
MQPRAIELKGRASDAARFPAICAPLVARTRERLLAETAVVAAKRPDILEWRVDFFDGIADAHAVVETARLIKRESDGIPLLFTRRNAREGGEPIALSEARVVAMYRAVCEAADVDLVDFEMDNDPADVRAVREVSRAHGIQLVLSFHDFNSTPPLEVLRQRFAQALALGADVAKVAVMPRSMDDVLTLMGATSQAGRELTIPLVSMSMGRFGALSRMCGWTVGSAMTFAVGESSSAPGQMAISDVEAGIALLQKALRPGDL